MALLFYAAMVSTLLLYAFNLVGILVALLGRSATKIILLIIRIMMCQIKKGFLTFYFSPQLLIGRRIQLVKPRVRTSLLPDGLSPAEEHDNVSMIEADQIFHSLSGKSQGTLYKKNKSYTDSSL